MLFLVLAGFQMPWPLALLVLMRLMLSLANATSDSDFDALAAWVRSEGGIVDERLELRTNSVGLRGLYTSADVRKGTLITLITLQTRHNPS